MFPTSKFKGIPCPIGCKSNFCHFGHFDTQFKDNKRKQSDNEIIPAKKIGPSAREAELHAQVQIDWKSEIPQKQRQKAADKIYQEFKRIYANLERPDLVLEHTLKQEIELSKRSSKLVFANNCVGLLRRLRQRPAALDVNDVGIDGEYVPRPVTVNSEIPIKRIEELLVPLSTLVEMEYPIWDDCHLKSPCPVPDPLVCDRCSKDFKLDEIETCYYHPLRFYKKKYPCCLSEVGSNGCTIGKHVFKVENTRSYQLLPSTGGLPIIAIDCEMCYTTKGMEVVRVSAVDFHRKVLIDDLVKPAGEILDLNTRFSGVTSLEGVELDMDTLISEKLSEIAGQSTVIVGHGLENDFHAMGICHEKVLDTVALFPHDRGLPF